MKRLLRTALAALGFLSASPAAAELPVPEDASSDHFKVGEVWEYQARPGEESSRIAIGRIQRLSPDQLVVHIHFSGLALKNPAVKGGRSAVISHSPISETALLGSVTKLTQEAPSLEGFDEGYQTWLAAYRSGDAGVFTTTAAEIVGFIEEALNR